MITVPNEFQPVGKYNIGLTAGIETTNCDIEWVRGCNRMERIKYKLYHKQLNDKEVEIPPGQIVLMSDYARYEK